MLYPLSYEGGTGAKRGREPSAHRSGTAISMLRGRLTAPRLAWRRGAALRGSLGRAARRVGAA